MTKELVFAGCVMLGQLLRVLAVLVLWALAVVAVIDPAGVSVVLAESYEQACALAWQLSAHVTQ